MNHDIYLILVGAGITVVSNIIIQVVQLILRLITFWIENKRDKKLERQQETREMLLTNDLSEPEKDKLLKGFWYYLTGFPPDHGMHAPKFSFLFIRWLLSASTLISLAILIYWMIYIMPTVK